MLKNMLKNRKSFNIIKNNVRTIWESVPLAPPDPIMGLTESFNKCNSKNKINLSVGAYRDEFGEPYILDSVQKAKEIIINQNHEYPGIAGDNAFCVNTLDFALGGEKYFLDPINSEVDYNRFATIQTISGTGANRIAGEFISRFYYKYENLKKYGFTQGKNIYLPNPTWSNHLSIFKDCGLKTLKYSYYNSDTKSLDYDNMMTDIYMAPPGSVFLFHVCAHNPTGVDPTKSQWQDISDLIKLKKHTVLFDFAYQGFASGDIYKDAYPIQLFMRSNIPFLLAQSYSKNFGLYSERIGALSVFCKNRKEQKTILSQLKAIARPMYSNPPINGAKIINTILEDNELYEEWKNECSNMANRIIKMRELLNYKLTYSLPYHDWKFITNQIGMFCYTGFDLETITKLRNEYNIFMTNDGRISISGLNEQNIDYFCNSVYNILK